MRKNKRYWQKKFGSQKPFSINVFCFLLQLLHFNVFFCYINSQKYILVGKFVHFLWTNKCNSIFNVPSVTK